MGFLVSLVVGGLVFWVVLRLSESNGEVRSYWWKRVTLSVALGVVLWKLTPLWTRWEVVFYNPLLLISMNPGMAGVMGGLFAFVGVAGFSLWQARKMNPGVKRRPLLVPLAAGALVVGGWAVAEPLVFPSVTTQPGSAVQTLVGDLEGRRHALADWKGKVVVVNFWATWCPPCLAEIPDLITFAKSPSDRLVLVGVDLLATEKDGVAGVVRFAAEHKMTWTQLTDTGDLQQAFGVTAVPTTVVLDPSGRLVDRKVGPVDLFWLRSLESRFAQ